MPWFPPRRPTRLDGMLWVVLAVVGALVTLPAWPMASADARALELVARYGHLPVAQVFDFPVGGADAHGYHLAQRFGENLHLGEDWNSNAGPEADRGEPVSSVADGVVTYARTAPGPWGRVVRVVHHVRRLGRSTFVESVYAHLDEIAVAEGQTVSRGQALGTIGDADGRFSPHLHLEIRRVPDLPLGAGYSSHDRAWLDPSAFIEAHRP